MVYSLLHDEVQVEQLMRCSCEAHHLELVALTACAWQDLNLEHRIDMGLLSIKKYQLAPQLT